MLITPEFDDRLRIGGGGMAKLLFTYKCKCMKIEIMDIGKQLNLNLREFQPTLDVTPYSLLAPNVCI